MANTTYDFSSNGFSFGLVNGLNVYLDATDPDVKKFLLEIATSDGTTFCQYHSSSSNEFMIDYENGLFKVYMRDNGVTPSPGVNIKIYAKIDLSVVKKRIARDLVAVCDGVFKY